MRQTESPTNPNLLNKPMAFGGIPKLYSFLNPNIAPIIPNSTLD